MAGGGRSSTASCTGATRLRHGKGRMLRRGGFFKARDDSMNKFTKIQRYVLAPRGSSAERIGILVEITLLFALMSCPGFGEAETRREVLRSPDGRLVLRVETQP